MRKTKLFMIITILFVVSIGFTAEKDIPEKSAAEVKAEELTQLLDELPVNRKALETKTYSGTITEIREQRVIDVNDVKAKSLAVRAKAVEFAEVSGLDAKKADVIKNVIESTLRKSIDIKTPASRKPVVYNDLDYQSEVDSMKTNAELLVAVDTLMADANVWPDESDPNYYEETARLIEFQQIVEEICNPS